MTGLASVDEEARQLCRPATEQRRAWHHAARLAWLLGEDAPRLADVPVRSSRKRKRNRRRRGKAV